MTSASARGLATITHDGTVLDVWFPAVHTDISVEASGTERLEEVPQQFADLVGPDEERGVARIAVETSIKDLDEAPADTYDAYLRLHLLSHRAVKPHGLNVDGIFGKLANVVWTNYGPCAVADFQMVRGRLASRGPVVVYSVDKFPRMVDYVVPSGVRIGERCLLGANSGVGISLGDDAVVEAGLYVTAGTKIAVFGKIAEALGLSEGDTIKGSKLSGVSGVLLRRNSVTGAVEAVDWKSEAVALNEDLHKN